MQTFVRAILAGCLIGLGGSSLLAVGLPIVNALFFAVCLLTIVQLQLRLYTGGVGFVGDGVSFGSLLTMLCGNFLGVALLGTTLKYLNSPLSEAATTLLSTKAHLILELPVVEILLLGVLCGVFVHIAVGVWRTEVVRSELAKCVITLWSISSFILCGFEHCIADAFYLFAASENVLPLWKQVAFVGLLVVGNGVGGILTHRLYSLK